MAIEDAEALGYLFRDVKLPISSSTHAPSPEITKWLEIFQSLRMDRTQIVQVTSRQLGGLLEGEAKENAGEYNRAEFYNRIIGYAGFEAVYKAYLAEGNL
jgi:salicylate hydroxylase